MSPERDVNSASIIESTPRVISKRPSTPHSASGLSRARKSMGFVLPVFTGSVLVFIALIFDWLVGQPFRPFAPIQLTLLAAGAALIGSGLLQDVNRVAGISVGICLPILSVVLFLGLGEAVFRVIQFDFRNQEKAWRTMAPFFRQPIVPTGKGLFRRGGPDRWS